jgi:hypothetical protein
MCPAWRRRKDWGLMREVETNSRPLPPKHRVRRGPCTDQKARRATTIASLTKSAKPPSPVQIRAAPPKFLRKSRVRSSACLWRRFLLLLNGLKFARSRRVRSRKALIRRRCAAAVCEGEEVWRTSSLGLLTPGALGAATLPWTAIAEGAAPGIPGLRERPATESNPAST